MGLEVSSFFLRPENMNSDGVCRVLIGGFFVRQSTREDVRTNVDIIRPHGLGPRCSMVAIYSHGEIIHSILLAR